MECLVVGDLHLENSRNRPTVPDDWQKYDIIIFVGDILDHSSQDPAPGRELFRQLNILDIETIIIPGNHDFSHYPEIVEGLPFVQSIHKSATIIDGWIFYGLGSDRFDDGSEIRYPEIPELSNADSDPKQFERQLFNIIEGKSELNDIVDKKDTTEAIRRSVQLYQERLGMLDNLVSDHQNKKAVLVTHLPPFGTGIDQLSENNPRYPDRMIGSIAVRSHIRRKSPIYNFCGHVHEGEGIVELAGCTCLNAGNGSIYSINLDKEGLDAITQQRESITK